MRDYYQILGVPRDASKAEIQEIFHKLAHIYHPDKGGNEGKFKEINEAYTILCNEERRSEYDTNFNTQKYEHQESPKSHHKEEPPDPHKHERIYEVSNKIKSSKWNAFLLNRIEVEEYLADGSQVAQNGFFGWFSVEKRNDVARRNARYNTLLQERVCKMSDEYIKHHSTPVDKEIIAMIIEPTKNVFNQKLSFVFGQSNEDKNKKLRGLVEDEKRESGDIVAYYPISAIQGTKGVLFITTKGICFIKVPDDTSSLQAAIRYSALNTFLPLGAIATGLAAGASHFIAGKAQLYITNKDQQSIINLAIAYSACLTSHCFEGSQFISYDFIKAFIYSETPDENNDVHIEIVYHNGAQVFLWVQEEIMQDILEKLSGVNPPNNE